MKRALLVEHQSGLCESLSAALEDGGYHAERAASLAQARSLLEAGDYHLVIANERLPDGRGYDIAAAAEELGIDAFLVTGSPDEFSLTPVGRPHLRQKLMPTELTKTLAHFVEGA